MGQSSNENRRKSDSCPESVVDRRSQINRRNKKTSTGLERRRGPGRRRSDFIKAAEEGEMNTEQFLFIMAIEAFKKVNQRPFPTWTEVLEVIRKLGYRKTMASELNLQNTDDWTEQPDTPSMPPNEKDDPAEFEMPVVEE